MEQLEPWRSVHKVAARLRRTTGPRESLRTAVEILSASFGPELSAFAVQLGPGRRPRIVCVIGRPADAVNVPDAVFARGATDARCEVKHWTAGDRHIAYAPLYHDRSALGGIGLASTRGLGVRPAPLAFLVTVAALLEIQLANQA